MHLQIHRPETGIGGNRRFLPTLYGIFAGDENVVGVHLRKGIGVKAEMIAEFQFRRAFDVVRMQHRKETLRRGDSRGCRGFGMIFQNGTGEKVNVDDFSVTEPSGIAQLARCRKTWGAARDGVRRGIENNGVYGIKARGRFT